MAKEAEKPVVGVDLGGTKVLAGVVDRDKVLQTAKKATKGEMGIDIVVERIAKTVCEEQLSIDFILWQAAVSPPRPL